MKVLYVVTRTDDLGGAQVHVRDLACRLAADGHEAAVVSGPGMLSDYRAALEAAGVGIREVPSLAREIRPASDFRALRRLVELFRGEAPDLVSLHSSKAGWLGRVAARRAGVRCVYTAHGWSFASGVPKLRALVYRLAERAAAPLANAIITVSDSDRTLALSFRVGREEQIVTVHNGMPDVPLALRAATADAPAESGGSAARAGTESSASSARRSHPAFAGDGVRLTMVARFSSQKDHATLLEAVARLAREWAESQTGVSTSGSSATVELALVGEGPDEYAVRRRAYDLGIDDRVLFLGRRDDVAELLAASDVYVLATNWEGLPRSIIEALRAGLPVVATDLAGIPELVAHDDNGYLVERGNAGELSEMLRRLLADAELRTRMGRRSRERYEAEFTFDHMYRRTIAVYNAVTASS